MDLLNYFFFLPALWISSPWWRAGSSRACSATSPPPTSPSQGSCKTFQSVTKCWKIQDLWFMTSVGSAHAWGFSHLSVVPGKKSMKAADIGKVTSDCLYPPQASSWPCACPSPWGGGCSPNRYHACPHTVEALLLIGVSDYRQFRGGFIHFLPWQESYFSHFFLLPLFFLLPSLFSSTTLLLASSSSSWQLTDLQRVACSSW